MIGRPGLGIGEHGNIWTRPNGKGSYVARTRLRDRDGRIREVTATGASRGMAARLLRQRLAARGTSVGVGLTAAMTLESASAYWLQHRARTGLLRRRGSLKPQTLAAYNDAIRLFVVPALGRVRIGEITVGLLDAVLADIEHRGQSTAQARSVLSQLLGLAVRHGARSDNPMQRVAQQQRDVREVEVLSLFQVRELRRAVRPGALRKSGRRGSNSDLRDVVDGLLGTGCRVGELLALKWQHVDLDAMPPTVLVSGTLVEPRMGYVDKLHRQESTKGGHARTLILPHALVEQLRARKASSAFSSENDPVFVSRVGGWLWPSNIRTRLRAALVSSKDLSGTTPHTLRRTVGTLIAHNRGLDDARDQLGHSDSSVTFQAYVSRRAVAPDLRSVLAELFVDWSRDNKDGVILPPTYR